MPIETLTIPIAGGGLDKRNEPILGAPFSPNLINMNVYPTVTKKRFGYSKLGLNLPLKGTGMEVFQYIDALGGYHTIGLTTTNAWEFNGSTKMWECITPSFRLEDCEDVWVDGGDSHTMAVDATAGEYVRGSKSVKITLTSEASDGDLIAYENMAAAIDLTGNYVDFDDTGIQLTEIGFWIKSSIDLAANALEIVVCEDANGAKTNTYIECLTTALTADTWTFVQLTKDLSACDSVDSVALYANATIADATVIRIDDVRAQKIFTGTTSNRWSRAMVYDSAEFSNNGGAALMITNDVDKPMCFEGSANDTFRQHANDLTNFASTKELIEFWNHLMFINYTDTARRSKQVAYADFGDCDDFLAGTSGANVLTDSVGALLRAKRLKADLVLYSERSITVGNYVGAPYIFIFPTLIDNEGLWAERGVYDFKDSHFLLGSSQKIYKFEGKYYLDSVGDLIDEAFFQEVDHLKAKFVVAGVDPMGHRLHFAFANASDAYAKRSYTLNYTQKPTTWEYHEYADTIRGISIYKNEYGWYLDGPEMAGQYLDEVALFLDESRTQEGAPVMITISDDGYVYQWNDIFKTDDGENIRCVYDSGDIVAKDDEYIRVTNFSFEALSAIPSATADILYSTDSGDTWTLIETVSIAEGLAGKWAWHRVPGVDDDLDVSARKCRFRIEQESDKDLQVRRRCCMVDVSSARS